MRVLVFSDTHGAKENACEIIEKYMLTGGVDAIIHAGDVVYDEDFIKNKFSKIPIYAVCGNNDLFSDYPDSVTVTLGGKKIFITHGHKYGVRTGTGMLKNMILNDKLDMVIYGHTHIPELSFYKTAQILNPGSLKFGKTYAVLKIKNGQLRADILDY